jgi:carbohydrate binding protein with CBM4/9 domain
MKRTFFLPALIFMPLLLAPVATCWSQPPAAPDQVVLLEGVESKLPDLHTYRAEYSADTAQAHSGTHSLRVTPTSPTGGAAYFRLDGVVDLESDYEFSTWVYVGDAASVRFYISASDGGRRHTKASVAGGRTGRWVQIVGTLRGEEWKATDTNVMLAMSCTAECWFDDVTLRKTKLPDPPIHVYPQLAQKLRGLADRSPIEISAGMEITLQADNGALAAGLQVASVTRPENTQLAVPPDGLLTFALDVPAPLYVTGTLRLAPDDDLRPGLRAYVLSDDTVVAAPMVTAEAWEGEGNPLTGPAPSITGTLLPCCRMRFSRAAKHVLPCRQT